jgi:HPt (histidine-containing phosphotransfer) domain-containing protein
MIHVCSNQHQRVAVLLIDLERVEEVIDLICGGEHAAFNHWIDSLESDLATFETLLPGAGTAESDQDILSAVHSIKGTCLNLGVQALADLFAELEQAVKEGKSAALNQRYAASRDLQIRSIHALREIAAKGSFADRNS